METASSGTRDGAPPATEGAAAVQVFAVRGLPLVAGGDDLAALVGEALQARGPALRDGDVVVVAQKVVSKAEGRARILSEVTPGEAARALAAQTGKAAALCELILGESQEVLRARPGVVIVRHRLGPVAANAGVDASNVADPNGPETVLLWPEDPDASARRLRRALEARFGVRLAVVISDSLGRAWRMGTIGSAIGVSGLGAVRDRCGEQDLFGRTLQATVIGVADEIAAAASLVIGEAAEATPAAVVRGVAYAPEGEAGIAPLLRPLDQDLFR